MQNDVFLLARIVDHTPLNIVVADTGGVIQYINRCAETTLGRSRDQILNAPLDRFISPDLDDLSWPVIRQTLVEQGTYAGRVNMLFGNSGECICDFNAYRIDNVENTLSMLVVTFRDITMEVRYAGQIERKNVEMAKMNSELIRSNTELMRLSEMKSNFLSIASHELKTPLTSIKGYSDIIIDTMQDKLDPATFKMVESISRAADRLHRVVNNILDVARIEQKRLKLNPEELDLCSIARDCIEELAQFSVKRGMRFECDCAPNLPSFLGDRMRMQQVFTNLFSNALKYSPDNSRIAVSITLDNGEQFHIVVKDFGIGIDAGEQKKIFSPFYEVGSAMRHFTDAAKFMGGGTGLGLSIVKGIVERHGGAIWVMSEGSKPDTYLGSEFHVLLPLRPAISWDDVESRPSPAERLAERVAENRQPLQKTEEKPSILLIDSDREAVEISRMVLENAFEVLFAETGEAGLTIAFQRKPSLILLDSYLPGLDGYRICRILKSQEETHQIPVAFFSAGTQNDEIQKCFASGAVDFIVKPFSGKELVEKIWRLLMKKKEGTLLI
jgi:two-component system, sensor histidine kinase ChiS